MCGRRGKDGALADSWAVQSGGLRGFGLLNNMKLMCILECEEIRFELFNCVIKACLEKQRHRKIGEIASV